MAKFQRSKSAPQWSRRRVLQGGVALAVVPATAGSGWGSNYPTRPIRWLVGFAAGGASTTITRIVAEGLSARLGEPVVVENKPGASGYLAIEAMLASPPDGYTIAFLGASTVIYDNLLRGTYSTLLSDLAPVSGLIDFPLVLITNPSVPAKTVGEFIAYAKANPGKINFASFGTGSTSHVASELFKSMAGIDMVHVPYRGDAPALIDLVGGRVQAMFEVLTGGLPFIRSGTLNALGVAGNTRSELLPDVPTIGETIPGYEAYSWAGIAARAGTPPDIVERLNHEINAVLADAKVKARLAELASSPLLWSAAEFGRRMQAEVARSTKVAAIAGISLKH